MTWVLWLIFLGAPGAPSKIELNTGRDFSVFQDCADAGEKAIAFERAGTSYSCHGYVAEAPRPRATCVEITTAPPSFECSPLNDR